MATHAESISARSWLFAPGDSERKMEKATAGTADIVIFDLEDAVAEAEKPKARSMVSAFLAANAKHRARLWVRINPIQGPHALADLAAVMPGRSGRHHVAQSRAAVPMSELLDHYLTALEAAAGIADRRHQGDAPRDRDAGEHARDRKLCRRAARGRPVLGRRRPRDRARRKRQSR